MLRSEGIVDQSLYLRFVDAYGYGAASTVNWVEARMRVLLDRARQGEHLSLFSPQHQEQKFGQGIAHLRSWVEANFPGLDV